MYTLNKLNKSRIKNEPSDYWFSLKDMAFEGQEAYEWNQYIFNLNVVGCRLTNNKGRLIWNGNPSAGVITAKSAYKVIIRRNLNLILSSCDDCLGHMALSKQSCF